MCVEISKNRKDYQVENDQIVMNKKYIWINYSQICPNILYIYFLREYRNNKNIIKHIINKFYFNCLLLEMKKLYKNYIKALTLFISNLLQKIFYRYLITCFLRTISAVCTRMCMNSYVWKSIYAGHFCECSEIQVYTAIFADIAKNSYLCVHVHMFNPW